MALTTRARIATAASVAGALALLTVGPAIAANISGTPKSDLLRGSAGADRIAGGGGNDKLYGLGGSDSLNGGAGNDVLVGGPGRDKLACGPGRDVAMADVQDTFGADCETVNGLPKPDLSVADISGPEGNSGTSSLTFPVELATASRLPVTVTYATQNGTAAAGSDFTAASGSLVFKPGETAKSISVAVVGDDVVEENETFTVALSKPVNAKLARESATGMIMNEDVPKPKAGRYAGSTSQGRAVSFDINPERTQVTGFRIAVDISCPSVGFTSPNEQLDVPIALPLSTDWRFGVSDSYSDSDGSIAVRIDGRLSTDGTPATGTLRIDMLLNTSFGQVACSSGDVTWSAPPPA